MAFQNSQWQVLLVEDSQDNQLIFKLHLQTMNAVVSLANNGQEALDSYKRNAAQQNAEMSDHRQSDHFQRNAAQTKAFDLILMDLQMPVMNGYDATLAIRDWEKQCHYPETPIIALTASATSEELEKALSVGCNDHLTKPLKKEDLQTLLVEYEIIKEPSPSQVIPKSKTSSKTPNQYVATLNAALEELAPKILEIKHQQAQEIEEAIAQQDFDQIKKLGHKIRGSHGLEYVNEIGRRLEAAAKEDDIDTSKIISDELKTYLDRVEIRFEKEEL